MESLAKKYPKYYKALPPGVKSDEIDTYVINRMFPVDDPTGTILHARKKLLIPGVRSGGKSMLKDVIEARDTLNRYIALMDEPAVEPAEPIEEEIPLDAKDGQFIGDGWFRHARDTMPEVLDGDELVEVRLASTTEYTGNFAKPAKDWVWLNDGTYARIVAWRLLKIEHAPVSADCWKTHTLTYLPEGLDREEMVEVKLSNGHEVVMAKRADQWDWSYRQKDTMSAPHITHWRRFRHNAV